MTAAAAAADAAGATQATRMAQQHPAPLQWPPRPQLRQAAWHSLGLANRVAQHPVSYTHLPSPRD
eukprot:3337229-Alexandrium_andersonii.AAC.1